ncbi:MAG TPA: hypothetical protein PK467_07610, partial [Candidatus Wallbacteria bacterium]|nr:hypothetical protein [Candidatus Wallbacteria bacterium]
MKKQFSIISVVLLVSFMFVAAAFAGDEMYSDKAVKALFTKKVNEKPTSLVHFAKKQAPCAAECTACPGCPSKAEVKAEVKAECVKCNAAPCKCEVKAVCKCGVAECKCGCIAGAPCACEAKLEAPKVENTAVETAPVEKKEVKKVKKSKKSKRSKKAKKAAAEKV